MTQANIQTRILGLLDDSFADGLSRLDPSTGRLLSQNGQWAIGEQTVIYSFAFLYTNPASRHYRNDAALQAAIKNGDAIRAFQHPDGSVDFVKSDGSVWGKTFMPWPIYPWAEAYRLLRDALDEDRRARWEQGLRLWAEHAHHSLTPESRIHNIPAYDAAILARLSQIFGEPAWMETAKRYIARTINDQHLDGFWAEAGCPTTLYNLVYYNAIGLYYCFTKDETALPALKRALDFQLHFTYPDGSCVETVDGRVKYTHKPSLFGSPAMIHFGQGRALLDRIVSQLQTHPSAIALNPCLTAACEHFPGGDMLPIPQTSDAFVSVRNGRALVRKSGPWFYCMNGYTVPPEHCHQRLQSRWMLDMQNIFSVWNETAGLVIGGGNSKQQPQFSTFTVTDGRRVFLSPDRVDFETQDTRDIMTAHYGDAICRLEAELEPDRSRLNISLSCVSGKTAEITARLTFRGIERKDAYVVGQEASRCLLNGLSSWSASLVSGHGRGDTLQIGAMRIDAPDGASFDWPEYPFNPYAINNASDPEYAVGCLSLRLRPGEPAKRVIVRVAE